MTAKPTYHQRIVSFLASHGRGWATFGDIYRAIARHIDSATADREYKKRHPKWEDDSEKDRISGGKKRLIILSLISLNHHRKMLEVKGDRHTTKKYRLTKAALEKQRTKVS